MSMQNRQIAEFRGFLKAAGELRACLPVCLPQPVCSSARYTTSAAPHAADARSATYRSFVFSKPKESAGKQATGLNFVEGSVEATVGAAAQGACRFPEARSISRRHIPPL